MRRCIDHSMHCAAFHFIKALGVPSQVTQTGKRKRSRKTGKSADEDNDADDADDLEDNDADDGDEEKDLDDIDIGISMGVDASADDVEAM